LPPLPSCLRPPLPRSSSASSQSSSTPSVQFAEEWTVTFTYSPVDYVRRGQSPVEKLSIKEWVELRSVREAVGLFSGKIQPWKDGQEPPSPTESQNGEPQNENAQSAVEGGAPLSPKRSCGQLAAVAETPSRVGRSNSKATQARPEVSGGGSDEHMPSPPLLARSAFAFSHQRARGMAKPSIDQPWIREVSRRTFIAEAGSAYGEGKGDAAFAAQREKEYPALRDTVYLDHAASPPAPLSTLHAFTTSISQTLYSNPHSRSTSSLKTSDEISSARTRVLSELFGVASPSARSRWDVIFTSGATAALKLVSESYPWKESPTHGRARYRYLKEAHTSLVGIRGPALENGADVESMDDEAIEKWLASPSNKSREIFAYPAQCNATGSRLGLDIGRVVKKRDRSTAVLLDASAYLSTSPLDLDSLPFDEAPDFIVCSFYKLFGYPTGLGCLVVKLSDTGSELLSTGSRAYFGGGTIDAISVDAPFWSFSRRSPATAPVPSSHPPSPRHSNRSSPAPRSATPSSDSLSYTPPTSVSCSFPSRSLTPIHDAFEDGTLPFLSIIALNHAMTVHRQLYTSNSAVSSHTTALASFARRELSSLRHANGSPAVLLHKAFGSLVQIQEPGPTIAFTLMGPLGKPVGHVFLDRLASINSFQLRTGGLCNTGVLSEVCSLDDTDLLEGYHKGRRCWDDGELLYYYWKQLALIRLPSFAAAEEFYDKDDSKPLGLARISFGASSTVDDVLDFIEFVRRYFVVSEEVISLQHEPAVEAGSAVLKSVVLYPIKSCGGQALSPAQSWDIAPTGLVFDREWMLVSPSTGLTLSQKRIPRMALIRPVVDLESRLLHVTAIGMPDLHIPLDDTFGANTELSDASLCGDVVSVRSSTSAVDTWFSSFLGVACRLARLPPNESRHGHFDRATQLVPILLSNESPFLLISQESVDRVNDWIEDDTTHPRIDPACFRANFIVAGTTPFAEDVASVLRIGEETFSVLARYAGALLLLGKDEEKRSGEDRVWHSFAMEERPEPKQGGAVKASSTDR
ncbi:molybdenum cofactor sulfurtransferase, partial [Phenoliferia sp. Uapishka_3]